jgi:hypothetical protein
MFQGPGGNPTRFPRLVKCTRLQNAEPEPRRLYSRTISTIPVKIMYI